MIELGLGLGLRLGLGFMNNEFINIVACWMKCCCIWIKDFLSAGDIVVYDQAIVDAMTF